MKPLHVPLELVVELKRQQQLLPTAYVLLPLEDGHEQLLIEQRRDGKRAELLEGLACRQRRRKRGEHLEGRPNRVEHRLRKEHLQQPSVLKVYRRHVPLLRSFEQLLRADQLVGALPDVWPPLRQVLDVPPLNGEPSVLCPSDEPLVQLSLIHI